MHILIKADADSLERIWQYCQAKDISMYYGRVHHEYSDIAWQIVDDSSPYLDILLLMFPAELQVLSPF